jgi:hypothetical protein
VELPVRVLLTVLLVLIAATALASSFAGVAGEGGKVSTGTTYYFSNAGDDDLNTGKSEADPWATAGKVYDLSFAGGVYPGDSFLFKRGDTWATIEDSSIVRLVTARGVEGKPITIGAYGTGADPMGLIRYLMAPMRLQIAGCCVA